MSCVKRLRHDRFVNDRARLRARTDSEAGGAHFGRVTIIPTKAEGVHLHETEMV